jgi:hypothetical protein
LITHHRVRSVTLSVAFAAPYPAGYATDDGGAVALGGAPELIADRERRTTGCRFGPRRRREGA